MIDDKEIEWQLTDAEIHANAVLMTHRKLKEQVQQLDNRSEDTSEQRRLSDELYLSIHLLLWHYHQLSRVFWPAKCGGETGLELGHKAIALRAELDLPDLQHPLHNEKLWAHSEELYRVVHEHTETHYQVHHFSAENQVITWMDDDAMFCLYEPVSDRFVLHGDEFMLAELFEQASSLQLAIQTRLDQLRRMNMHSHHPADTMPSWGHRF